MQKPSPQGPFRIFESFTNGVRICIEHRRLFAVMSFLPFAVTLLTRVAYRFTSPDLGLFWQPLILMPSLFVIGLECALLLRFVLAQEYPILEDSIEKAQRNRSVVQSGVVFAIGMYFFTGAVLGLTQMQNFMTLQPQVAAPWSPLVLAGMVLMMWAARWLWLHVPIALDWPVNAFFDRVGRWSGSLRIFLLFAMSRLAINFLASFFQLVIMAVSGKHPGGFAAAFDDAVIALATVAAAVLFTACTAAGVKSMMRARSVSA